MTIVIPFDNYTYWMYGLWISWMYLENWLNGISLFIATPTSWRRSMKFLHINTWYLHLLKPYISILDCVIIFHAFATYPAFPQCFKTFLSHKICSHSTVYWLIGLFFCLIELNNFSSEYCCLKSIFVPLFGIEPPIILCAPQNINFLISGQIFMIWGLIC